MSVYLQSVIRKMWMVEEDGTLNVEVKSFPVGYAFINVIDGQPFQIFQKGQLHRSRSYLAGPQESDFSLRMKYVRRALTIQIQPFALPAIFAMPANEAYNEIVPLELLNRELAEKLEALVLDDLPSEQVLQRVETTFRALIKHDHLDPRVPNTLSLLMKEKGLISMRQLADDLNTSQRRLQQLFQQYFGSRAKTYARVVRMQHHTYQLLNGCSLDAIVPEGYYDQSHFIHELRKQTGMLPGELYSYITMDHLKAAYLTSNLYHPTHPRR